MSCGPRWSRSITTLRRTRPTSTSSGSSIPTPRNRVRRDRKSTRLNSSHTIISYAVFCLKKKPARLLLGARDEREYLELIDRSCRGGIVSGLSVFLRIFRDSIFFLIQRAPPGFNLFPQHALFPL